MTKAKVVAKTGANSAKQKVGFLFGGKKIVPVRVISANKNFMSAQYENGDLVLDLKGQPEAWTKIRKDKR